MIQPQRSSGVGIAITTTTVAYAVVRAVDVCVLSKLKVDRKSETRPRSSMHKKKKKKRKALTRRQQIIRNDVIGVRPVSSENA